LTVPDPQAKYEAEQAALRKQGGYETPEDAEEEVTYSEPEVNPEVWRDMDSLLFRGFIYQAAQIGDVTFVFKSLNQHEFERLLLLTKLLPRHQIQREQYNLLLALGVWVADGENALVGREQNLRELRELFKAMPHAAIQMVVRHMSELNRRANRATVLTEAYAYEQASRFRWLQTQGLDISSPSVTGVAGTESLGLNWGQLAWRALNRLEDNRLESEAAWENAKFIASSMAGSKGMSRINSQDKSRRKNELEDRRARKDKIIRQALFGEKALKEEGQQVIQVARTVEELADQLERDLKGEKDWHDTVVDAYQKQIEDTEKSRRDRLREIRAIQGLDSGGRTMSGATDFRGMSRKEVEEHLLKKRREAQEAMESNPLPLSATDPVAAERADRWINALPINGPSKEPGSGQGGT
jgi:hypothetical protein